MFYIALVLTLISIFMFKGSTPYKSFRFVYTVFAFLSFISLYTYQSLNHLTGRGVDESVVFHLVADLSGAGIEEFSQLIFVSVGFVFLLLFLSALIYRVGASTRQRYLRGIISLAILLISFWFNPLKNGLELLYAIERSQLSENAPELFKKVNLESGGELNSNLIYLYLESLERTYLDEDLFPGLLPNLKKLEGKGLSFTNVQQAPATGWTIAGMVASQCGIPLFTPPHGSNTMAGVDKFLPRAICLGDILNKEGYSLHFMGGADLAFAGKGKFYESHGFQKVNGFTELTSEEVKENYRSSWGLFDDTLFSEIQKRLVALKKSKSPYGLFALNLDTHHPNGHVSKRCENVFYGDGSNQLLNVIHCLDQMVGDFYKFLKEASILDDTTLVISSDHLAMRNSTWDLLKEAKRHNLFDLLPKIRTLDKARRPVS